MTASQSDIWKETSPRQFAQVLTAIDGEYSMQNFLRDVMTEKEIIEISARFEAAKMLRAGAKYTDIAMKTKLSSRTIARISDWLQNGTGGYDAAISLNGTHQSHISPARAT